MTAIRTGFFAAIILVNVASTAEPGVPELRVRSDLAVFVGDNVTVPIEFLADGENISAVVIPIDFDETTLSLDCTDADMNGIPDSIVFNVPPAFQISAVCDLADPDGEIDILVFYFGPPPLATLPDGLIVEITFQDLTSGTECLDIGFSGDPEPSFGDDMGMSVPGVWFDGVVGPDFILLMTRDFDDVLAWELDTVNDFQVLRADNKQFLAPESAGTGMSPIRLVGEVARPPALLFYRAGCPDKP